MQNSSIVLKALLREVIRKQPNQYFNKANTIQSSVGLIFRVDSENKIDSIPQLFESELSKIELLFTQRAGFESDKNACIFFLNKDNVVFPGGQCDSNESDL